MLYARKSFEFCYSHFLPYYNGKCANLHGHNAVLEVTVRREGLQVENGMVIDFNQLKSLVAGVLELVDHSHLNENPNVGEAVRAMPTCENLICWLYSSLNLVLPKDVVLVKLKLSETPTSWCILTED